MLRACYSPLSLPLASLALLRRCMMTMNAQKLALHSLTTSICLKIQTSATKWSLLLIDLFAMKRATFSKCTKTWNARKLISLLELHGVNAVMESSIQDSLWMTIRKKTSQMRSTKIFRPLPTSRPLWALWLWELSP